MQSTKRCPRCGVIKSSDDFYVHRDKTRKTSKLGAYCKICHKDSVRDWNHASGNSRPMSDAKDCALYLGVHIAERVLSNVFNHVDRMPPGNPGYDFICDKGYKIDVKSSCLVLSTHKTPGWHFGVGKNKTPDYFLFLAFDTRESLNPQHLWLIPGHIINDRTGIWIAANSRRSKRSIAKWSQYEKPLGRVIKCCNAFKEV